MPLIQYTLYYYRKCFPSAHITIMDNESTDGSREFALSMNNVSVHSFSTNNTVNDKKYIDLKNSLWKGCRGWVIVVDMDEWLDATEEDLWREKNSGTTVLQT